MSENYRMEWIKRIVWWKEEEGGGRRRKEEEGGRGRRGNKEEEEGIRKNNRNNRDLARIILGRVWNKREWQRGKGSNKKE